MPALPALPLPSLPLPVGAKVMVAGHSYAADAGFTGVSGGSTLNNITATMTGLNPWLQSLNSSINADFWGDYSTPYPNGGDSNRASAAINGGNQGVGGDQFVPGDLGLGQVGFYDRIPFFIARGIQIAVVEMGINDFVPARGNQPASVVISRAMASYDRLRNAGIYVIAPGIIPVSSAWIPDGDPKLADLDTYNAFLAARAASDLGFRYVDMTSVFGAASGRPVAGLMRDGLHKTDKGSYLYAQLVNAVLAPMVTAGEFRSRDPLVSNSYPSFGLLGTGGTAGAGVTGLVATNFTAARASGDATIVASKEVISGSLEKQVFVVTPGAATSRLTMNLATASNPLLSTLGWAVGDWVQLTTTIELSAWDGWVRATGQVAAGTSAATLFNSILPRSQGSTANTLPTDGYALAFVSAPFQIPATSDRIRTSATGALLDCYVLGGASGIGTIKVSKPILRKITDPRTAWNLP